MDVPAKPTLDTILFQVIYGAGYTYLDRCGQTLVDIERARPDWTPGEVSPHGGNIANQALRMAVTFGSERFDFNVLKFDNDIAAVAEEAHAIWTIVQDNLNLSQFVRVACRFQWLVAKPSIEVAEQALSKAPVQMKLPDSLAKGFTSTTRSMVAGLRRDSMEYRVGLQTVTRLEGLLPTNLVTLDPRWLPSGRRKARMDAIKNRQNYNANPMYAVNLDVDCVTFAPTLVKPVAFIKDQYEIVRKEFVPLVDGL